MTPPTLLAAPLPLAERGGRRAWSPHRFLLVTWVCAFGWIPGGCATREGPPAVTMEPEVVDPWEGLNRKVFAFNEALDIHAVEPVARGWDRIIPDQVQQSLTNFRSNLRYPIVFVNDLCQGNAKTAAVETARFLVNTTLGFGGLFDPATTWGLPRRDQDFSLTLGRWGVETGRYLVLPLLGPSTVRDLSGGIVDAGLGAISMGPLSAGWIITMPARAVQLINMRAAYLSIVDENRRAAFDYYSFVRDAYLQHRESLLTEETAPPRSGSELYYPDTEKGSP